MTHGLREHNRMAGVAALVAVLVLVTGGSAAAHTELVGSTPADGATVPAAPAAIVLEFNEPVQAQFGQVAVLDASDGHHELGDPQVVGATVTQGVDALAPGSYRISYRVGSADGHPVTGTLTFTVDAAAPVETASPTPSTQPTSPSTHVGHTTPSAAAETDRQTGNTSALLVTGGGIVVAAVLGAALYVAMAGRRPDESHEERPADTGQ